MGQVRKAQTSVKSSGNFELSISRMESYYREDNFIEFFSLALQPSAVIGLRDDRVDGSS